DAFVSQFGPGGRCEDMGLLRSILDGTLASWGKAISSHQNIGADDPDLRALRSVRKAFLELCRGEEDGCEVELDPRDIANLCDRIPARIGNGWASYSVFLQPGTMPGGGAEFVVNHIYQGMGTL